MHGPWRRDGADPRATSKSRDPKRFSCPKWGVGPLCGLVLFLATRPASAQVTLDSQVLSESGISAASGSTELLSSEGQPVIGTGVSGSTDTGIGFLYTLSSQFAPAAANPPFTMVGNSSLTINWLANGNPTGTSYDVQLSTVPGFVSVLASTQTQNLNATFTGLNANVLYYAQAAVHSSLSFTQLGSTYTLAVPPGSPVGISTFTGWSPNSFTLNWSSGTSTVGYNSAGTLYLAQISTSAIFSTVWASTQTTNLNTTFTGLIQYVNYYARVQAISGSRIATSFTILGSTFTGLPFVYPALMNRIAGSGLGFGGDGGPAVNAHTSYPWGVAVDGGGTIYFSDGYNSRIRKVDSNGIITTIAGTGVDGFNGDGMAATGTQIYTPRDIVVYGDKIYFVDQGNYRIRKIDANGIMTTVAGNGTAGFSGDGGLATSASLSSSQGLGVDAAGNIIFSDSVNQRVREITADGIIKTIAGSGSIGFSGDGGQATAANLNSPDGVAFDPWGGFYIADTGNHRVRHVDANGVITTFAGNGTNACSGDGGAAVNGALSSPDDVGVSWDGSVYVSDNACYRIRRIDSLGTILTTAGGGFGLPSNGGLATSAQLFPYKMAIGGAGSVYYGDINFLGIWEISLATSPPLTSTLLATDVTPNSISWGWNKIDHPTAYMLKTSTGGYLSNVLSNRTSYFVEVGLSTNTSYSGELVEVNSAGSSISTVVTAWTAADMPGAVAILSVTTASVAVSWGAATNPGSTRFEVSYTTSPGFAVSSDISTATLTTSTFTTLSGLIGQTTYYVRVRAYNGDGVATAFASIATTATAVLQSSVTALSPSTGTVGVAFTITGTGFGAASGNNTQVRFGAGGSTAPVTSWSDTQIVGVVPLLSSGAYALRIERQGAVFTATNVGTFTVVTPYISTATPITGTAGFDLGGSGFGNFVDSVTTRVTLDGSTVTYSSWADSTIRCVVSSNTVSVGTHTAVVIISSSVGSVQSNAFTFNVSPAMLGLGLVGSSSHVRPRWLYQANLRLRGSHGATVTALSHAAVTVPGEALGADTSVTIDLGESFGADRDAREKARLSSALGDMGAPIEFGPSGTRFRAPVTIELPYDVASVPPGRESELTIHYWNPATNAWDPLPTEVDSVLHRLRARTDHFSLYQPLLSGVYPAAAAPAAFTLVDVYAFPNPSRNNHVVTIRAQVGLADDVSVHIYDISGRLVNSGSVSAPQVLDDGNGKGSQYTYDYVWDTSGAGSGVYMFAVTAKKAGASPIRKTGKVGVIK